MQKRKILTHRDIYSVACILKNIYKDFNHNNKKNPFSELLFILCSVQTSKYNSLKIYNRLRQAILNFKMLERITEEEIVPLIVDGGLARQRAKAIRQIADILISKFGKITLSPLKYWSDKECETFLVSLPRVGMKVARCIMMYSLGRQVFPVDTHCWRICRRLGWVTGRVGGNCSSGDMDRLQEKIPSELRYSLHVNMISLGREFCLVKKPKCHLCPISSYCKGSGVFRAT
jgi:endonuclease III